MICPYTHKPILDYIENFIKVDKNHFVKPLSICYVLADFPFINSEVLDMAKLKDKIVSSDNIATVIQPNSRITVKVLDVREVNTKFGERTVCDVEYKKKKYSLWLNQTSIKKLIEKGIEDTEELINRELKIKKMTVLIQGQEKETVIVA